MEVNTDISSPDSAFSKSVENESRLTRDGTVYPLREIFQILRREHGEGKEPFPLSADHEQDWQPYPVDPYDGERADHTYRYKYSYSPQDASRKESRG